MDVGKGRFHWELPRMLRALTTAHFVAIDFELSGIQSKAIHKTKVSDKPLGGIQTLQQRYEEIKEAAERYQILQVGLTVVKEDKARGSYVARPYNIYLNPLLNEKLELERIISFQSGAVEFLLKNGFDIGAPFSKGVPYLSRAEEANAFAIESAKGDKSTIDDIHLRQDEVESIKFVRRVREEIEQWKKRSPKDPDYVNIAPEGHSSMGFQERGLNNYQKRLVHQLVRAEYPEYVTISRPGFIQVAEYDADREKNIKNARLDAFKEKVCRQVGLRWVFEAMAGGNLDNLNPVLFAGKTIDGKPTWIDMKELNRAHNELRAKLKVKKAVLVGHNLFMDLINFYRCFIGPLPDSVHEFQSLIHEMFPLVIDTKYMATHSNSKMNARSGLEELDLELCKMGLPVIDIHPEHQNYTTTTQAHEAGYDSFLTAKILMRLAVQLDMAGKAAKVTDHGNSDDEGWYTPAEEKSALNDIVNKPPSKSAQKHETASQRRPSGETAATTNSSTPLLNYEDIPPLVSVPPLIAVKTKSKKTTQAKKESPTKKSKFSHPGMFDLLGDIGDDMGDTNGKEVESDMEELESVGVGESASSVIAESSGHVAPDGATKKTKKHMANGKPAEGMMPRWDSDFWLSFANKLRVNGTVEGICYLDGIVR